MFFQRQEEKIKGWAYNGINGFQLDTMRVLPFAPKGVGHLIWAASMAWAQENTPCSKARLLAKSVFWSGRMVTVTL